MGGEIGKCACCIPLLLEKRRGMEWNGNAVALQIDTWGIFRYLKQLESSFHLSCIRCNINSTISLNGINDRNLSSDLTASELAVVPAANYLYNSHCSKQSYRV